MPVVSNVTGDVAEQQVDEVEEDPLEVLFPDKELEDEPLEVLFPGKELEEEPLELEEEGREFAKEHMANIRVIRCVIIFNLSSLSGLSARKDAEVVGLLKKI